MKKPDKKNKQEKITLEQEIEKADRAVLLLETHGRVEIRPIKNLKYTHEVLGLLEALKIQFTHRPLNTLSQTLNLMAISSKNAQWDLAQIKKHFKIKDEAPKDGNIIKKGNLLISPTKPEEVIKNETKEDPTKKKRPEKEGRGEKPETTKPTEALETEKPDKNEKEDNKEAGK